jgi:hypothetical protein
MIRKRICTASIFLGFLAVIAALIFVRVPNSPSWLPSQHILFTSSDVMLFVWLWFNLLTPLVFGYLLLALWSGASALCDKIRGKREGSDARNRNG